MFSVIPNQNDRRSWAVSVYGRSNSRNTRLVSCNDHLLWQFFPGSVPCRQLLAPFSSLFLFFLLPPEIGLPSTPCTMNDPVSIMSAIASTREVYVYEDCMTEKQVGSVENKRGPLIWILPITQIYWFYPKLWFFFGQSYNYEPFLAWIRIK